MTDSRYPNQLDDDVVLPRVDNNISEIGGDAINGLRSAVFAIEACLGIDPQGTTADLATRLDESLNPDGSIRASALSSVGLAIVNSMVANNAGIKEAKLDMNYPTVDLKTWIDSLWVFVYALSDAVNQDIHNLTQHVAHPSAYGRHRTSDIDGYYGHYASYNLQGIVTDLYNRITTHVGMVVGAHAATAISFDDHDVDFDAVNVQTALEELNELHMATVRAHQDNLHSNGILKTQEAFYGVTNHSYTIVGPLAVTASAGSSLIVFPTLPAALAQVSRDDRIDVTVSSRIYRFYVASVDPTTGIVNFWGTLPVSGVGQAIIYKTSEELSEPSTLMLAIRQERLSESPSRSIIQMIHPGSPYIIGSGSDLRKLSASQANVKFSWSGGTTATLNIYTAMGNYPSPGTLPSAWTVENLAIVLNSAFKQLSPPHRYPLVAFAYRGEIGIAFDEPTGYIQALACANSAWTALGFTGTETVYSLGPRRFYLDGYEFSSVRLITDANGQTDGTDHIIDIDEDLPAEGIKAPGVMRVSSSVPADNGTYAFDTVLTHILGSDGYNFTAGADASVRIYADTFVVSTIQHRTLYELFVDGYNNSSAELRGVERVMYQDGPTPAGSPESWFDIVDVSRTFAACERRINIKSNVATFGESGSGKLILSGTGGPAVTLPTPTNHNDAIGYRFRLYDGSGVDYVELEVADGSYIGAPEDAVDVTIYDRISEERHVEIGVVLHDTVKFKHLSDRRLFGTVGRKDVREDYTRDYVTYPTSLLRGNGVIYGMDVLHRTPVDGTSPVVNVDGGQVLVNGIIYTMTARSLQLPVDNIADKVYNLFVDDTGTLKLMEDNGLNSDIATPSTYEIIQSYDKVLIARIISTASNCVKFRGVTDLRRFVNNLDNKAELIVDAYNMLGSFASLNTAIDYLSIFPVNSSVSRTIRIRGDVPLYRSAYLPQNTTLIGDGYGSSGTSYPSSRITYMSSSANIEFETGNTIKNLGFFCHGNPPSGLFYAPDGVSYLTVEGCVFEFGSSNVNNIAMMFESSLSNSIIRRNTFRNVGMAIYVDGVTLNTKIEDNTIFEMLSNGIYLVSSDGSSISRNKMITATVTVAAGTAFIRLGTNNIHFTSVVDNLLIYNGTQPVAAADMAMINVNSTVVTTSSLSIERNFLENTTLNTGFAAGILCTSVSIMEVAVRENHLYNFSNTTYGKGIELINCPQVVVEGNMLSQCCNSIVLAGAPGALVANNIVRDGLGNTLYLGVSCDGFNISGNHLLADGTDNLCYLINTSNYGSVCNNLFEFPVLSTSNHMMLFFGDGYGIVQGNKFVAGTLTGPAPLVVSGDKNLIVNNSFSITSPLPTASDRIVIFSGIGNVIAMNKGQSYVVWIPMGHAIFSSNWTQSVNTSGAGCLIATACVTGSNEIVLEFSAIDVPAGAALSKVTVWYSNVGLAGDMVFQLYSTEYTAPSSLVVTSISSAIDAINTMFGSSDIVPTSSFNMPAGSKYVALNITGKNLTNLTKIIHGIAVTYTL